MSSASVVEGDPTTLEYLIQCLSHWQISSSVAIASLALIFYDWLLTSSDEFDFLWQRGRGTCARVVFILARYPALACAVVGVLPLTIELNNVTTCLSVVTILSSEFILAMRTWAIWERRRSILVFLVTLFIVCATPAIVVVERDMDTSVVVASASWHGVKSCRVQMSVVKRAWVVPYISIMVFESTILSLTLYKVTQCYRAIPSRRSKLLDVLWIDGVIYFIFMLILGILNVGLALNVFDPQLRASCTQLQTVAHSVLSTRIVLHTGQALRQGPVYPRPSFIRDSLPRKMVLVRASEVAIGQRGMNGSGHRMMASDVELQQLINNGT